MSAGVAARSPLSRLAVGAGCVDLGQPLRRPGVGVLRSLSLVAARAGLGCSALLCHRHGCSDSARRFIPSAARPRAAVPRARCESGLSLLAALAAQAAPGAWRSAAVLFRSRDHCDVIILNLPLEWELGAENDQRRGPLRSKSRASRHDFQRFCELPPRRLESRVRVRSRRRAHSPAESEMATRELPRGIYGRVLPSRFCSRARSTPI